MSTQPKTFQELIEGDTPVLVDFFADWCGPCKMMQPILEDTARQMGEKVKIIKVDVDKNPLAASKFQVRGVPTLILFHKGKTIWRQSGVVPAHQLTQIIQSSLTANA
jgi:thioredoxin 1